MRLVIFFCFSCIPKILLIYLGRVVVLSPQIVINLCRTYEKLLRKGEPCRQDPLVQKTDKHPITYYKDYIIVLVPVLILFNTTVTLTLIYNFYIRDRWISYTRCKQLNQIHTTFIMLCSQKVQFSIHINKFH